MTSHILAIGGGGFSGPKGGPNPILKYFLGLTEERFPKVCLIPTAMGDRDETVMEFVRGFNRLGAHPNYLSLYHIPTQDLEDFVLDFDAVYVSGGNTKNLLALWSEWKLDRILKKALKKGVVLGGASAGGICWFEQGSTDSWHGEDFSPIDALGWLEGSFCPHYADDNRRRPSYLNMVKDGRLKAGYAATDFAALHFVDSELSRALIAGDDARICRVELKDAEAAETELEAEAL